MNPFSFMGSNAVSFGIDRVEQLADDIAELDPKTSEIAVIADFGIAKAGILDRIRSILARSEYDVTIFSELTGEPHAAVVDQVATVLRRLDHPVVVGVGGGSALDVAKLAAVIAEDEIAAEDYALCARPFPQPGLKRILIPTTAGTGSEVTRTAVFTTRKENKVWAWGHELLPEMVLLDPSLTLSLPADITAATGLDAMVHAIEACTCQNRNPMADALGLHAIRLGRKHLMSRHRKTRRHRGSQRHAHCVHPCGIFVCSNRNRRRPCHWTCAGHRCGYPPRSCRYHRYGSHSAMECRGFPRGPCCRGGSTGR